MGITSGNINEISYSVLKKIFYEKMDKYTKYNFTYIPVDTSFVLINITLKYCIKSCQIVAICYNNHNRYFSDSYDMHKIKLLHNCKSFNTVIYDVLFNNKKNKLNKEHIYQRINENYIKTKKTVLTEKKEENIYKNILSIENLLSRIKK